MNIPQPQETPPLATPPLRRTINLFQKPQFHKNLFLRLPVHQPAFEQQWLPPLRLLLHPRTKLQHRRPIQRLGVLRIAGERQHEETDFEACGVVLHGRNLIGAVDGGGVERDDCPGREVDGFDEEGLGFEDEVPVVGEVERAFVEGIEGEGAGVRYGGGAGGGDVAGENVGGGVVGEGDICGKGQDGEGRESEH